MGNLLLITPQGILKKSGLPIKTAHFHIALINVLPVLAYIT